MQIFISMPSGRTITLDVEREDNMSILKHKIEAKDGLNACLQRLVFAGKQLEDGLTVGECGIEKEATILALLRLLGGRGHVDGAFTIQTQDVSTPCICEDGRCDGEAAVAAGAHCNVVTNQLEVKYDFEFDSFADDLDAASGSVANFGEGLCIWNESSSMDMFTAGEDSSCLNQWESEGSGAGDSDANTNTPEEVEHAGISRTVAHALDDEMEREDFQPSLFVVPVSTPTPVATLAIKECAVGNHKKAAVAPALVSNPKLISKGQKGLSYNLEEVDDKLRKRLLKNRRSAERSRHRKNAERKSLDEQLQQKDQEKAELQCEVDRLKAILKLHQIAY